MAADKRFFLNGRPQMERSTSGGSSPVKRGASMEDATSSGACIRLFVAGAVSHVGKTTVCLSLLKALRQVGLAANELAYIKPATQCEAPDLLAKWCKAEGIEHVAGENAPLVFYQGFTRSFLAGEQGTSADWLQKISRSVDSLAQGRRALIVDGVGFPAVGSIVGVDNADVARASKAPVLLVCRSGVGAAVDSFSLNSSYFLAKGVPVLGAVFNFGDPDGFNSWDKCAENISRWFSSTSQRRESYYGVVPKTQELDGLRERIGEVDSQSLISLAELNAAHFARYVDVDAILADAAADPWNRKVARPERGTVGQPAAAFQPLSRKSVSKAAAKAGAKGGG